MNEKPKLRLSSSLKGLLQMVAYVACLIMVLKFVIIPASVSGSSMMNNLNDGDILLMNGLIFNEDAIDRFDIVVIETDDLPLIIKRVIGLPGETITYKNDVLTIDGVIYEEDFLDPEFVASSKKLHGTQTFTEDFSVTLKDNEFFMMGDNRLDSSDSREFGPFTLKQIKCRKGLVIYPFEHAKLNK